MNDVTDGACDDDDDWGDFDSNIEDDDYDPSTIDNNKNTTEAILSSQLTKSSSKHYIIHSQNDIKNKTNFIVEQVSSYLSIDNKWNCTLLLRHFKWNKDRLFDKFFEIDSEHLFQQCGLLTKSLSAPPKYKNGSFECPMCLDVVNVANNSFEIGCSHQICNSCWNDYIVTNIKLGKQCINIKCPYFKCNIIIPPQYIIKFIPSNMKDLQYRYQRFTLENYIENCVFLSFCPSPNCNYIIEIDPGLIIDIECKCGSFSCSKCKLLHSHRPCPCTIANKWTLKNSSDSENVQWILAKTKQCPKCKVPIEKNHGCNHMSCTKCSYEFCWLCRTDWKLHGSATGGFYKCNIYDSQKQNGVYVVEEKKQEHAQNELERYSFYLKRFDNHIKSGHLAQGSVENKYAESNMGDTEGEEEEYVIDAFKVIVQCRKLLAWTYPIGYYLPRNYKKLALFIDCQQQLEKYTEHLHQLLEDKHVHSKKSKKHKHNNQRIGEINNFMRVTKRFRDNLMNSIEAEIGNDLLEIMKLH